VRFDGERGGVLCSRHAGSAGTLPTRALDLATRLLADPWGEGQIVVAAAEAGERKALRDLCAGLVRAHLRRPLRSLALFRPLGVGKGEVERDGGPC
jgi:hypothetical protein